MTNGTPGQVARHALATTERYKNHHFPDALIRHGVWLYYRFTLRYRDVQGLLFERDIIVSHEALRKWCRKFGQDTGAKPVQQIDHEEVLPQAAQRMSVHPTGHHHK